MTRVRGLSLLIEEQQQFEPLNNLAEVPYHTTYVELNLVYVNPNQVSSKIRHGSGTLKSIVSHHPAHCQEGTRYSCHRSMPSARVAILTRESSR